MSRNSGLFEKPPENRGKEDTKDSKESAGGSRLMQAFGGKVHRVNSASSTRDLTRCKESPNQRFKRSNVFIGAGSFKSVWRGYDTVNGFHVAWNSVDLTSLDPIQVKQIEEEIRLLQNMDHTNILKIIAVFKASDELIFITPLCAGNLKERIAELHPVRLSAIKRWCLQILKGLVYLHGLNVVHRDLKCENILLTTRGRIRIADFGISGKGQQLQTIVGTPCFMAPEVFEMQYSNKVDVYAFGMCILEMFTNKYPYEECKSMMDVISTIRDGILPLSINELENIEFRNLVETCLSPESERPASKALLEHPAITGQYSHSPVSITILDELDAEQKKSLEKYTDGKAKKGNFRVLVEPLETSKDIAGSQEYRVECRIPIRTGLTMQVPALKVISFEIDRSKDDLEVLGKEIVDLLNGQCLLSPEIITRHLRRSLNRYEFELLFCSLQISREYAKNFIDEDLTVDDLTLLSKDDLSKLLPHLGPRRRLENHLASRNVEGINKSSDVTQVRMSYQKASEIIKTLRKQNDELKARNARAEEAVNDLKPDRIPGEFICPITLSYMKHPVRAQDNQVYERDAIANWLESHRESPLTGINFEEPFDLLRPEIKLKERIEAFRLKFPQLFEA